MRYFVGPLAALLSTAAFAQQPRNLCEEPGAERDPRCQPAVGPLDVQPIAGGNVNVPTTSGGSAAHPAHSASGGNSSGGCGNMDGHAALVIAVVAAVALPAVVYLVDDDAQDEDVGRYEAFHVTAGAWGGAMNTTNPFGLAGIKGGVTFRRIGGEATFEGSPLSPNWRSQSAAFLFRFPLKQHLELGLSIGYRWTQVLGQSQFAGELAVPQRYVLFRAWGQGGGFDLRPAISYDTDGVVDLRVDGGFTVPLGSVISFNVSGRLFTFKWGQVNEAVVGGLSGQF